MKVGQIINFNNDHHSGVYERVYALASKVADIYANPGKYKNEELDHHLKVALRELAMEDVRREEYPDYPSRLESLYVSKTLAEANDWFNYFIKLGRKTYQIVKVKVNGSVFNGDASDCFDGTINRDQNIKLARIYWKGEVNKEGTPPVYETIVNGKIRVLEIVKVNKELI